MFNLEPSDLTNCDTISATEWEVAFFSTGTRKKAMEHLKTKEPELYKDFVYDPDEKEISKAPALADS